MTLPLYTPPAPAAAGTLFPDASVPLATGSVLPFDWIDTLQDAVLVLDATGRVSRANGPAWRCMREGAMGAPAVLADWLDEPALQAVQDALAAGTTATWRRGTLSLARLDERFRLLVLRHAEAPRGPRRPDADVPTLALADAALRQLHGMLWASPFPAMLQDEAFRLVDVNQAFADLVGSDRRDLVGRDPLDLLPPADREAALADRLLLASAFSAQQEAHAPALVEQRLLDRRGQLRSVRTARYLAPTQDARRLVLSLMQETTAEHAAREQALQSSRELDQWFDLSPLGLVLFDEAGLVLRANTAFKDLCGTDLADLREAPASLRALLAVQGGDALHDDGRWVAREGGLPQSDGAARWVRVLLRCHQGRAGQPRYMGMVEDRTAEEERDLAHQQLGALVETAGGGVASIGGIGSAPRAAGGAEGNGTARSPALQGIRREWVEPASLPEYEKLQRGLRQGERCEARYAIAHPELGRRWLLTRVEPGRLGSGRVTTSVVTLDVTDQQVARERAEQLLAELSSILESSPAGIASMQGLTVMHCNQRFESMLGLAPGAAVGSDIRAVLGSRVHGLPDAPSLQQALAASGLFESEIEVPRAEGEPAWFALTMHASSGPGDSPRAIAVLSDITRLKTQQRQLEALAAERANMARVVGQQADRTRAMLDSVLVGIVTVDGEGTIAWLNRSARRMFGGGLGDFIGQSVEAVAADDEDHPFTRSRALLTDLREGEAVKFECRVRARDGRTFWVVGNAVATVGADGRRELTYALMDIEQRRQAEARVAEARASLQRIIEAAPMAITLWDANTLEAVQMNRAALELAVGDGPTPAVRHAWALFPGEAGDRVLADLHACLAEPQVVLQREWPLQRADGRLQTWEARYMALGGRDGATAQVLMVASDVTDQRAAQRAELAAAIAQRDMLVQEVHHRIKNNLQGVAGLMQQVAARRPEVQPVIAEVVGQVQAIAQVYGLQVGRVGPLQLRGVVQAIAQSVQRTFGRSIVFEASHEAEPDWLLPEAESIPIALTLNELMTNAIKHSPAGCPVHCSVQAQGEGVRVQVVNAGRLPEGFALERRQRGMSGLGLVRSLLPRRQAWLTLEQAGESVHACVDLAPPVVQPTEQGAGMRDSRGRDEPAP